MYKKEVKINGKKYSYYYYNLREEGRVRNICLGSDRKLAKEKEVKLREEFNLLEKAPEPAKRFEFGNVGKGALIILIILSCLGFFYLFNGITGLVVYSDDIVLDVNEYVSSDALVFLTVNLEEYNKSISEFGIEADENE